MCSGAILLYGIPRVVIGENKNYLGEEDLLRSRGVEVIVLDDKRCVDVMRKFIEEKPEVSRVARAVFGGALIDGNVGVWRSVTIF